MQTAVTELRYREKTCVYTMCHFVQQMYANMKHVLPAVWADIAEESLATFRCVLQQRTCRRSNQADAGNIRDEAWCAFFRSHIDVRLSAFIEKHRRGRNTFCTVLRTHGNQHQARGLPGRGTAFSRRRPPPTRAAASLSFCLCRGH